MNQDNQINRLVKKGLFDERLREQRQKTKQKKLKIIRFLVLVLILIFSSILIYQLPSFPAKISSENQAAKGTSIEEITPSKKEKSILKSIFTSNFSKKDQPDINILTLGRPGSGWPGSDLTDTIILAHLKPNQEKAILISLPRDLLVKNPEQGHLTKINSLYNQVGIEGLKQKVKEITGLTVDYYVLIDLVVTKEIIELIDGLNIYVPQDIRDPYFPGPNYTYQTFNLSAGWRYLDSDMALKYIRTRYTSPNGDFDRMARQQQVLGLLKQKVLELNLLWDFPTYLKILNSLRNHIETDLEILELKNLWQIARATKANQINNLVIDKKETNLLIGGLIPFGGQMASVVYPKNGQGNYQEIQEYIQKAINKK